MQNALCQGFAGVNSSVATGFANMVNYTNQGFSGLNNTINQGFAASALQNNQNTQSIINAICGLSSKIDANTIAELTSRNAALKAEVDNARQTAVFTRQITDLSAQLAACCCKINATTA
jgi:predicted porin